MSGLKLWGVLYGMQTKHYSFCVDSCCERMYGGLFSDSKCSDRDSFVNLLWMNRHFQSIKVEELRASLVNQGYEVKPSYTQA